jgi:hypothetical protein
MSPTSFTAVMWWFLGGMAELNIAVAAWSFSVSKIQPRRRPLRRPHRSQPGPSVPGTFAASASVHAPTVVPMTRCRVVGVGVVRRTARSNSPRR